MGTAGTSRARASSSSLPLHTSCGSSVASRGYRTVLGRASASSTKPPSSAVGMFVRLSLRWTVASTRAALAEVVRPLATDHDSPADVAAYLVGRHPRIMKFDVVPSSQLAPVVDRRNPQARGGACLGQLGGSALPRDLDQEIQGLSVAIIDAGDEVGDVLDLFPLADIRDAQR